VGAKPVESPEPAAVERSRRFAIPPIVQTIGLVLVGVIPFALFVYLQSGLVEPEPEPSPQTVEDSVNTPLIPLAFPFGEGSGSGSTRPDCR
jgi:hypothetical protein